jgi:NADPH:quinone reductase
MRAFQLKEYVGPAGLELVELPAPEPAPDAVLVDVRAIGLNFPYLLMTTGQYQFRPDLPTVPGCEVAGQVVRAPEGSGSTGDRVAAFVWQGSFAEQAAIPLDSLVRVPDEVDFAAAAAMVVNYHTVLFALFRRGRCSAERRCW